MTGSQSDQQENVCQKPTRQQQLCKEAGRHQLADKCLLGLVPLLGCETSDRSAQTSQCSIHLTGRCYWDTAADLSLK